ncbi:MAG: YqiA/YcfP family alpha/beta fold hydrolase [Aestuariibacter sp.]
MCDTETKTLIYLHGFLSSPQSVKAQQTKEFWQKQYPDIQFFCEQLPYHPEPTKEMLHELMHQHEGEHIGFIGSSLGGFLASYLVEHFGGKAVLINPAVTPYRVLAEYLGEHVHPYTQESFELSEQHMQYLKTMDTPKLQQPENYWVLLQTGDETLDYKEAEQKYRDSKLTIEQGGDHAFQGYERFLPDIFAFLFR